MLWEYRKLVSHTFGDYFNAFFIAPFVILYLSHFPVKSIYKAPYVLCWACACTLYEYFSNILGFIIYDNGWNIFWSFGFYCFVFPMIRLHYKKPLIAWPLSFGFALAMLIIFKVPLNSI